MEDLTEKLLGVMHELPAEGKILLIAFGNDALRESGQPEVPMMDAVAKYLRCSESMAKTFLACAANVVAKHREEPYKSSQALLDAYNAELWPRPLNGEQGEGVQS